MCRIEFPLGACSSEKVTESLEAPTGIPAGAAGCVDTRSCVTSVNAYVASRPFDCGVSTGVEATYETPGPNDETISRACCSDKGSTFAAPRPSDASPRICASALVEYTIRWSIVPLPSSFTFSSVVI